MIKPDRIFFQIPFCCSSENRRCAVDFEPYCAGISSHLHPTDRTNRIPLIVILSLHRGRPVLAGFGQMFYYCVPLGISHFFVNHEKCICVVIVRSVLSQIIYKMICFRISWKTTISVISTIVLLLVVTSTISSAYAEVPGWVKNNAGWWADGTITESEFISGVEFLITDGIISPSNNNFI